MAAVPPTSGTEIEVEFTLKEQVEVEKSYKAVPLTDKYNQPVRPKKNAERRRQSSLLNPPVAAAQPTPSSSFLPAPPVKTAYTKNDAAEVDLCLAKLVGDTFELNTLDILDTWEDLPEDDNATEVAKLRLKATCTRDEVRSLRSRKTDVEHTDFMHLESLREDHRKKIVLVQGCWRRRQARLALKVLLDAKKAELAATKIQANIRGKQARKRVTDEVSKNAVCICGKQPYGEMIVCSDCYDFFHLGCVGLFNRPKPLGKVHGWRCPDCDFAGPRDELKPAPQCWITQRRHPRALEPPLTKLQAVNRKHVHALLKAEPQIALTAAHHQLWPRDASQQHRHFRPFRLEGLSSEAKERLAGLEEVRGELAHWQKGLDKFLGRMLTDLQGLPHHLPLADAQPLRSSRSKHKRIRKWVRRLDDDLAEKQRAAEQREAERLLEEAEEAEAAEEAQRQAEAEAEATRLAALAQQAEDEERRRKELAASKSGQGPPASGGRSRKDQLAAAAPAGPPAGPPPAPSAGARGPGFKGPHFRSSQITGKRKSKRLPSSIAKKLHMPDAPAPTVLGR